MLMTLLTRQVMPWRSAADTATDMADDAVESVEDLAGSVEDEVDASMDAPSLEQVLADPRREDDRARDQYRNPAETLEFFGVEADDTVVEALPGGGWYGRILAPWLAAEGEYYGLNYPMSVFEQLFPEHQRGAARKPGRLGSQLPRRGSRMGRPGAGRLHLRLDP